MSLRVHDLFHFLDIKGISFSLVISDCKLSTVSCSSALHKTMHTHTHIHHTHHKHHTYTYTHHTQTQTHTHSVTHIIKYIKLLGNHLGLLSETWFGRYPEAPAASRDPGIALVINNKTYVNDKVYNREQSHTILTHSIYH